MNKGNNEAKKANNPAKITEGLYLSLFEHAPVGMGIADANGNLLAFNDAILKPGGYTREDIEKIRNVANLYFDAKDRDEALRLAAAQGFLKDYEVPFKRKDGTAFLARMNLTPVMYRGQRCWQATVEDITDRKLADEALKRYIQETETLTRIAGILVQTDKFQEKATRVLEAIVGLVQADSAILRLPDEKEQGLRLVARFDNKKRQPPPGLVPYGQGIVSDVMEKGESIIINDYKSHPRASADRIGRGVASAVFLPVKSNSDKLGIVVVNSTQAGHFSEQRVQMLKAVTSQMGSLLENARLIESLDFRKRELEALSEIAVILAGSGSYEKRIGRVMKVLLRISEADRCSFRQFDKDRNELSAVAWAGSFLGGRPDQHMPLDKSLVGAAYRTKELAVVNDYKSWPVASTYSMAEGTASAVAMPIRHERAILGVIGMASTKRGHFTPERVQLLSAVVGSIGAFLENAKLVDSLQNQAKDLMETKSVLRQRTKENAMLNDMFKETLDEKFAIEEAFKDLRMRVQGISSIADMAAIDSSHAAILDRLAALQQLLQDAVSHSDPEKLPRLKRILSPRDS